MVSYLIIERRILKHRPAKKQVPINTNPALQAPAIVAGSSWETSNCSGAWVRTQFPEHWGVPLWEVTSPEQLRK